MILVALLFLNFLFQELKVHLLYLRENFLMEDKTENAFFHIWYSVYLHTIIFLNTILAALYFWNFSMNLQFFGWKCTCYTHRKFFW